MSHPLVTDLRAAGRLQTGVGWLFLYQTEPLIQAVSLGHATWGKVTNGIGQRAAKEQAMGPQADAERRIKTAGAGNRAGRRDPTARTPGWRSCCSPALPRLGRRKPWPVLRRGAAQQRARRGGRRGVCRVAGSQIGHVQPRWGTGHQAGAAR